jgi:glutamate racemase
MLALEGIKMLVVACNTATAAAYDWLRERYAFPVVGVISPGARRAARCTRNGRIGVAATNGTVGSGAYRVAVLQEMEHATVVQAAMSWLVPLIEQGPVTRAEVTADLLPALETMRAEEVDTLILGCTHFPLVRDLFEVAVGPGVTVVDSADTTAEEVALLLHRLDLGADEPPVHRFLVTGPARAFAERATSVFRASPPIESVDLAWDYAS